MSNNKNQSESHLWDKKYENSREYENIQDFLKFSENNPTILAIEPFLKEGISILEIGSGTGELISYIKHKYPRCVTYGLDYSNVSIERAKINNERFSLGVLFVKGDIKNIPFEDNKFDIVFGDQVIGHIDDLPGALNQINRITKKNGIVAFTVANSLRPDGWYLNKKLSNKHEGYRQRSMSPWYLKRKISQHNFGFVNFYGDILILLRNISLIRKFFSKKDNISNPVEITRSYDSKSRKSFIKKIYGYLDRKTPPCLKVTIGIIAKKR